MTAGDIIAEVDRAILACRKQKYSESDPFQVSYLQGAEDGLNGLRNMVRSYDFIKLIRRNKSPRRKTNAH